MSLIDNGPLFPGEVPLPGKVNVADPGNSLIKSNADHGHPLLIDPWASVPLINGWADAGGGYRGSGIILIGNLVMMRGCITGGPAGISTASNLPSDYWPSLTEFFIIETGATLRLTIANTGALTILGYGGAGIVPLSGIWWTLG